MRESFVKQMLQSLVNEGILETNSKILTICAGQSEKLIFDELNFESVIHSSIRNSAAIDLIQDATKLTVGGSSFDFVFVADGLHHLSQPHNCIYEMYTASKLGIIVVESRDSLLMRLLVYFGISSDYEVQAVVQSGYKRGGLNDSQIPNYVYRWTEREFIKTVRQFDPTGKHRFKFFYGLGWEHRLASIERSRLLYWFSTIFIALLKILKPIIKRQTNTMGMVALKPNIPEDLWSWLTITAKGEIKFNVPQGS